MEADDPSRYRAFYVLLEPYKDAEFPDSLVECFGDRISTNVLLVDSYKNSFNISLSKEKNRFAFTYGIEDLLHYYDLPFGGWMRVFYLGGSEFHIHVMNRELNVPKICHQCPNHYEFGWEDSDTIEDHYDSGPETEDWDDLQCCDVHLYSSHFKKNRKALPCNFVRDAILPTIPVFCVIRDQDRRRFFCEYQFSKNNKEVCTVTLGWLDFVKDNNLHEGSVVKFGIRKGDPSVIHAKVIYTPVEADNHPTEAHV